MAEPVVRRDVVVLPP